jgi:hypothetical protein
MTQASVQTIHVVRQHWEGPIERILVDRELAEKIAKFDPLPVSMDADPVEIIVSQPYGLAIERLHEKMDAAAWPAIQAAMKTAHAAWCSKEREGETTVIFSHTPLDLPANLAVGRLEVLQEYGTPDDLPTQIELMEIIQANKTGREFDTELFREASRNCGTFDELCSSDEQDLQSRFDASVEEFRDLLDSNEDGSLDMMLNQHSLCEQLKYLSMKAQGSVA